MVQYRSRCVCVCVCVCVCINVCHCLCHCACVCVCVCVCVDDGDIDNGVNNSKLITSLLIRWYKSDIDEDEDDVDDERDVHTVMQSAMGVAMACQDGYMSIATFEWM